MKVVVLCNTWILAHVGRTLQIAKELRARGHEVVYAGADPDHPSNYLRFAVDAGFRVVSVKEPNWPWAWQRFHDSGVITAVWDVLNLQKWAPLDQIVEDIIRVAEEEHPDLLLGDASVGVSTAGHILGVKAAGILGAYVIHFFRPWSPYRAVVRSFNHVRLEPVRARVYRRHGVAQENAIDLIPRMLLLSPDLAAFHDASALYPNWQPIGPLVFEPQVPLPDWYGELDDGVPNVYVTMGSTGLLDPLLRRSYPALAKTRYRFLVTTGGQLAKDTIGAAPSNFRFAHHAPGSKLLEKSSALVFHGGNGTMYQALAAGVPMLALPSHMEQEISILPGLREGFARRANCRRISGRALVKEIDRIVSDCSYRQNALRFSDAVRAAHAPETAANLLENYVLGASVE